MGVNVLGSRYPAYPMQLFGVSWALAILVCAAGIGKLIDPRHTSGALSQMGLPSRWALVRVLGVAELAIGAAVVVFAGPVSTVLLAVLYLGFGVFVIAALRSGTPLSSCGCFGRPDTPPSGTHLVVNMAAAAFLGPQAFGGGVAGIGVVVGAGDVMAVPVAMAGVVLAYLLYALLAVRPTKVAA